MSSTSSAEAFSKVKSAGAATVSTVQGANQGSSSAEQPMDLEKMQQAFAQFNRLSENFVQSYQSLEDQVESLADRLAREVQNKELQLIEKERVASRLQNLLAILPAGVVVLDAQGRVQDCNAVAVDLLGRPLLGEQWINIINRCFAPRYDDGHEISLKDGRRVRLETRSLDYEPGQLIVLTDLTETRKLQDKVNQDKRLSSMGKMMASLAHQIRTPLSSALLYAEGLASPELTANKQQKFSQQLIACLSHLERHVNDMLQFARSGGLQKTEQSLNKVTDELVQQVKQQYAKVKVSCEVTQERKIWINTDAIFSAVRNLIDNAIQATQEVELPEVKITLNTRAETLIISVNDNGCGISQSSSDKIFEPFYTTKQGGSGLGLAVVHGVIKAHGGKVSVKSKPGSTQIQMILPLTHSAEEVGNE